MPGPGLNKSLRLPHLSSSGVKDVVELDGEEFSGLRNSTLDNRVAVRIEVLGDQLCHHLGSPRSKLRRLDDAAVAGCDGARQRSQRQLLKE